MTSAPAPVKAPPPARSNGTAPVRSVPKFTTEARKLKPAIVVNAVEGFGKTSLVAFAPKPAIIMARGEHGYLTLVNAERVPNIPHVAVDSWTDTLAVLDSLIADPQGIETLGIDAMGGFERLCHEHVCAKHFNNEWGEKGFGSFQKGFDIAVTDWIQMLSRLEQLRSKHGVAPVILSHCRIKTFKNPLGSDFDRYVSDVHDKTWAVTAKWADAVLFGNFLTVIEGNRGDTTKKGKGIGGTERVVYTERRDAFDAKNRYGMPEVIDIPADPAQTWASIAQYIK